MSARIAGAYLKEMVDGVAPRLGPVRAVEAVAEDIGLSYWPVYRLVRGQVKTITTDQFLKIRTFYLNWCLTEIRRMQRNYDGAQDHDLLENLESEVLALREKVRAARRRNTHDPRN